MALPHDETTQLSAVLDASIDQLSAIVRNVGEAWEASASYLSRPQTDPDAEFDPAVYLGSLMRIGQSMTLAAAAWTATLFDNATVLSERIPFRWLSEVFALANADEYRILDIKRGDESIDPTSVELVDVGNDHAQLSLVSLTAPIEEVTLTVWLPSDPGRIGLVAPRRFSLSMSADFSAAS